MSFRLGDRVRVLVLRASLEERKIDFRLVTADGSGDAGGHPAGRPAAAPSRKKSRR